MIFVVLQIASEAERFESLIVFVFTAASEFSLFKTISQRDGARIADF